MQHLWSVKMMEILCKFNVEKNEVEFCISFFLVVVVNHCANKHTLLRWRWKEFPHLLVDLFIWQDKSLFISGHHKGTQIKIYNKQSICRSLVKSEHNSSLFFNFLSTHSHSFLLSLSSYTFKRFWENLETNNLSSFAIKVNVSVLEKPQENTTHRYSLIV